MDPNTFKLWRNLVQIQISQLGFISIMNQTNTQDRNSLELRSQIRMWCVNSSLKAQIHDLFRKGFS